MKIAIVFFLLINLFRLDQALAQTPPLPVPQPGPTNTVLPLFQKPFAGEHRLMNFFDHNLPFEFDTTAGIANDFQLTWWGDRTFGTDGHNGYDWVMLESTPVLAVANGTVVFAGQTSSSFCPPLNTVTTDTVVVIDHGQLTPGQPAVRSHYGHLSRTNVAAGQQINAGDQIGLSGNVGCSTLPHLHFGTTRFVSDTG